MSRRGNMWRNWGRTALAPAPVAEPADEGEVRAAVGQAAASGQRVRAVGAGHSFSDCAVTDGVLLSLDPLDEVQWVGPPASDGSRLVRVGAGIRLRELCRELELRGLALENMGDIDAQSLAGAISTGTHGTGAGLTGFAAMVREVRLVTADGQVHTVSAEQDPQLFEAARLGLGALGVITAVTVRVVPAFTLAAVEAPMPLEAVLESLGDAQGPVAGNDHFELYWFPYTAIALTKANNRVAADDAPLSPLRRLLDDEILSNGLFQVTNELSVASGRLTPAINQVAARALSRREYTAPSHEVFVTPRRVRFREMEYAIPADEVVPALRAVDAWVRARRANVPFPVEVRFAAPDGVWLSTAYERPTAYVAVHQYVGLEYRDYFAAVAAIMAEHAGRPHWGKMHWLRAAELERLYPRLGDFRAVRDRVDPGGVFANRHTERVLGGG